VKGTHVLTRTLAAAAMVALAACGGGSGAERPDLSAPSTLPLQSTAFGDGQPIPAEFTCDGNDHPPPLSWSVPPTLAEYALTVIDLDASGFVHWVAFGIPAGTAGLRPDQLPKGTIEGANDFGERGYRGPCPPGDVGPHRYEFSLFALDSSVSQGVEAGASAEDLFAAIECCVQVYGVLTGTYDR
jgi:Raf kinase inhibitor-like YbhB/YbcL family protein